MLNDIKSINYNVNKNLAYYDNNVLLHLYHICIHIHFLDGEALRTYQTEND